MAILTLGTLFSESENNRILFERLKDLTLTNLQRIEIEFKSHEKYLQYLVSFVNLRNGKYEKVFESLKDKTIEQIRRDRGNLLQLNILEDIDLFFIKWP